MTDKAKTVERLLFRLAKVEARAGESTQTPPHLPVSGGHRDVVVLLLRSRAEMKAKDATDQTPPDLAEAGGDEAIMKLLGRANEGAVSSPVGDPPPSWPRSGQPGACGSREWSGVRHNGFKPKVTKLAEAATALH